MAKTYAIWDVVRSSTDYTFLPDYLSFARLTGGVTNDLIFANMGKTSGKWYWEFYLLQSTNDYMMIGLANTTEIAATGWLGNTANSWGFCANGILYGSGAGSQFINSGYVDNNVIGIAFDADNRTVDFYVNNVLTANFTGLPGTDELFPAFSWYTSDVVHTCSANFGQNAFVYAPPNGYNSGIYTGSTDKAVVVYEGVNPWREAKKRQDKQREEDEIIAIVKAIAKTML